MITLTSLSNPKVKHIIDLKNKSSLRKSTNTCVIEGEREINIAINSKVKILEIFIDSNTFEKNPLNPILTHTDQLYVCSPAIMEKIAMRSSQSEIVVIAESPKWTLETIPLSKNPFVLILENIEKPGNLGALFRTCDASQVDWIICTEMQTDIFNPNVIRNSLGCVFSQKIVSCSNQIALDFCKNLNIKTFASYLHTDDLYYQSNFQEPTALIFGTESTGISNFWIKNADDLIKIPMLGLIDSMNVSNAASILLYDVVRQRNSK